MTVLAYDCLRMHRFPAQRARNAPLFSFVSRSRERSLAVLADRCFIPYLTTAITAQLMLLQHVGSFGSSLPFIRLR
jgi:hypothetical protein